jgi:hypothetical protein
MKKILSFLLCLSVASSLCIPSFALDVNNTSSVENEITISTIPIEQLFQGDYWTILYDEINTTPITPTTLNREASTRADTMYTRLVIGYNRPDKRLAVGITNYVPSGTPYLFFSMSGKIWVVDEESYEVIIDGRDFTETNIIPDTSINTTAAIENIGLFKGEKISVTVSGTCAVSADIKIVPFSQTAHCVVSV